MAINFRKTSHSILPTIIKGLPVEMFESYKYLGTVIEKNPNHDLHASAICKNGMNTFNVDKTFMVLFYKSFIGSILTFCLILWYGNLPVQS